MYSIRQTSIGYLSDTGISIVGARGDLIALFSNIQSLTSFLKKLDKFLETPNAETYIDDAVCLSMKMCAAEIASALSHIRNALTMVPYVTDEIYKPEEEEDEHD